MRKNIVKSSDRHFVLVIAIIVALVATGVLLVAILPRHIYPLDDGIEQRLSQACAPSANKAPLASWVRLSSVKISISLRFACKHQPPM